MSDIDIGEHGGKLAGGAAVAATMITSWASRFFRARDEKAREDAAAKREIDIASKLGKLESDLGHALRLLERQEDLRERVAVLESKQSDLEEVKRRLTLVEAKASKAHHRLDEQGDG